MQRISLALLAIVAVAGAQEADPPTAPPPAAEEQDPNLLLSVALRGPQTTTNLVVTAKVKHEPPKDGGMFGAAGGGGMVVVQRSVGGSPKPFEGTVEACRMPDGSRIVVSKTQLPGFELHLTEACTIERTTFADERFTLDQLKAELGPLLDTGALAQRLLAAKLASRREGGKWVFLGDVAKDIVHPTIGMNPMNARVLRVRAKLTVSEKGRLEQAAITVIRNDPMREMMRGRMKGMRIQIGGAGAPPPPRDDDEKKHDIEGGSTTYTLTFEERQPSERVRAFQREVARLSDTR
ncbi:MAG: hypothetical protein ACYTDU_14585 [Planctomycetota bacterium]